jgi:hypothetical protein
MAKSEITALMIDGDQLRGVKYAPKGSAELTRVAGGVWPLQSDSVVEEGDAEASSEDAEAADPLFTAVKAARKELGGRDVVVAFPLSGLLLNILKMPVEVRADLADAVALQMDKISPFDEGEYSVGHEILSEDEESVWVLAASMSNRTFMELNESLSRVGWRVIRSDIALLGWLRTLCGKFNLNAPGRKIVLARFDDNWNVLVMNHGTLVLARCFGSVANHEALLRELTLSMINVEIDAGPLEVGEIIIVAAHEPDAALFTGLDELFAVKPVFREISSPEGGLQGVALRTLEHEVIDLTPGFWHTEIKESALRRKVNLFVAAACALWVVLMVAMAAGPMVYRHLIKRVRVKSTAHYSRYKAVSDTRKRVNLILSYTDTTYSPLEMLRLLSGYLPPGVTLTGFNYKRQDGVKVSGEADLPTLVYQFKNAVTENDLFERVDLIGPSASRGKHNFEVYAVFKGVAEQ